jgi:dynein heavy chain
MDHINRRKSSAGRSALGRTGTYALSSGLSSAAPTAAAVAAGTGRPALFAFDLTELDAFSLPKMKASKPLGHGLSQQMSQTGHGEALEAEGGTAMASEFTSGSTGVATPAAQLSDVYMLVKEAVLGEVDEHKSKEIDDYIAHMLSGPSKRQIVSEPPSTNAAKGSRNRPLVPTGVSAATAHGHALAATRGLTGGDAMAASALVEAEHIRSGEEAIAFFMKYGPSCPVKFVYLKRKFSSMSDVYRPYDLVVVPQQEIGEDYFVMSAKGVVHIEPKEPSEFHSLSDWMRDASAFNVCQAMRFFRYYLPRKVFGTWRANVRFNRYCKQRHAVRNGLFTWKPAFTAALVEVFASLAQLERIPLLHLSAPRYTIASFLEAQSTARTDAVKVIEKQISQIQAAIERVCADVVRRARAHDEDEDAGIEGGPKARDAPKIKSMAAQRAEAARKQAALKSAAEEEAMLGPFVRLVDYMTVETTARLVVASTEGFLKDVTTPELRRITAVGSDSRAGGGMFTTAIRFDPTAGTTFDPPREEFIQMAEVAVTEAVKACTSTPRVLYARAFREYVQELSTESGAGNLSAPTVANLLATSPEFSRIKLAIEDKFVSDFGSATQYVTVFESVRPIYDYNLSMDFEAYRAKDHTTYSLQRDMSRIKQWDLQLATMRMQDSRGCLFIDSKRLKLELEPVTVSAMDNIKQLLLELARDKCRKTCEAFSSRAKTLEARPTALDKFASHVERVQAIKEVEAQIAKDSAAVEDMYKLLQSYEVKISSEESVALDDMRNAVSQFTESYRASDTFLEQRMPEMTRQLDVSIIKVTDTLKTLSDSVNEGIFTDDQQAPATALEGLDVVKTKVSTCRAPHHRLRGATKPPLCSWSVSRSK